MARKKKQPPVDVAALQPDELNELKRVVVEYVKRLERIDNEIEQLREDKKTLKDEFEERLDIRTLEKVLRILKIESEVDHRHTFDCFKEVLSDEWHQHDED